MYKVKLQLNICSSGHTCVCPEGQLLLIETLHRGVNLYELPGSSPSCTFAIPSKRRCTKDAGFVEGATVIVSGSDHRMIYVFSIDRPEPIQTLKQAGARSLIQALDVRNVSVTILNVVYILRRQVPHTSSIILLVQRRMINPSSSSGARM